MSTILVVYQPHDKSFTRDLSDEIIRFAESETFWNKMDNVWLFHSAYIPDVIKEELNKLIDESDKLIVVRLYGGRTLSGFDLDDIKSFYTFIDIADI